MLTESQNFIKDEEGEIRAGGDVYLFGKEINDETYAICKSDMMIKGNDPENIKNGSTLSMDEFAGTAFDFMLSNPPYGKSWTGEVKYIKDGKAIIDPRFIVRLKDYWRREDEADATPRSSDGQLLFLMKMVSKMKSLSKSPGGSRIASVHNGSSLFTGDAGGGESNIRRYIIENDMLECIIQLPNNLFYNTGITTYIWLLSNNKADERKGKVQLIDAGPLYRKLRKNLGAKNCEFAPEHIREIVETYREMREVERNGGEGITSQVFDNRDFGYYKVTVERPKRLKAQFTPERIAGLRFEKILREPMQWVYETYGDAVYGEVQSPCQGSFTPGRVEEQPENFNPARDKATLAGESQSILIVHEKEILEWTEEQDLNLSAKQRKKLLDPKTWKKQRDLLNAATQLMQAVGTAEYDDFNLFAAEVNAELKRLGLKLSSSEKNAIFNAVTCYDASAAKVVKGKSKLTGEKLEQLLDRLGCAEERLVDFGWYATGKPGEYRHYETESDVRDTENVPLKEQIHAYFLREVKPHVEEAWINLDATKIGYEISFNKYFYRQTPLRSIEAVSADILHLETESEGLIHEILSLT